MNIELKLSNKISQEDVLKLVNFKNEYGFTTVWDPIGDRLKIVYPENTSMLDVKIGAISKNGKAVDNVFIYQAFILKELCKVNPCVAFVALWRGVAFDLIESLKLEPEYVIAIDNILRIGHKDTMVNEKPTNMLSSTYAQDCYNYLIDLLP